MLLFLNSCVLSLSAVLWTSLYLCGKFTSQSMLFLSCGVFLISVSVGENDGGCRGLDLFWGYLDDAYFLGWATLESSLGIFDLHKSRYKGNHRKIASGHFLLWLLSNLCLNHPAVSAIFLGWTQRNLSKLLPIKSNSRHINLWNFKVAPCVAVLVFSFLMRSSSSSSFPSWSMEESRTCLYAGGEENSSLICQTVYFLSVVFLSVCRLGSWKMERALWRGPSKTTSLTVLNRKL